VSAMNPSRHTLHCDAARNTWTAVVLSLLLISVAVAGAYRDELDRARQALDSGAPTEAVKLLESYRRTHTTDAEVYNLLGVAYGQVGDSDRSLAMFKECAKLAPNKPAIYNNLGAAYLRQGDEKKAEASFRHALRLSPENVNSLYNLGALLNANHKYSESRPLLQRALKNDRTPATVYEAAVAAAGTGDRKAALQILNSMEPPAGSSAVPWLRLLGGLNLDEGDHNAAAEALGKVLELAPDDEAALYALAVVWLKGNQPDRALPLLEKALAPLPASARYQKEAALLASYGYYRQAAEQFDKAAASDSNSYDALYNLAVVRLEHLKDVNGALSAAQRALAIKRTGELEDLLGDISERQDHFADALNHYQAAVRLDLGSDKFVFDLGAELLAHENYAEAQKIFHAGVERFPRAVRMYVGLGAAEFMAGKIDDSIDRFLQAVDLDPKFEAAHLFLGEAFDFSESRSQKAFAKLAYLAGAQPQSFGAQYYYGRALIKEMEKSGDLTNAERARAALLRAADLHPQDARVYFQMGELFRLQKQMGKAVPFYERSIALDPGFAEPLYKLGQTYVRLGKQEDAKKMFARHREVLAKAEADTTRRFTEIQSFVLQMRGAQ
jgi:tetratricopeptide (TPR) repeat protein